MSKEERGRRRASIGEAASEKISKSEQLNFRLEEKSISELQNLAMQKGLPVGTMIRQWVLERLVQEQAGNTGSKGRALHVLDEINEKLHLLSDQLRNAEDQKRLT